VQVGCPGSPGEPNWGAANAGIAMATIIAAVTNATTTNIMMRLIISATSFDEGGTRQPRRLLRRPTLAIMRWSAHLPGGYFWDEPRRIP
jgi:hypothetical protein